MNMNPRAQAKSHPNRSSKAIKSDLETVFSHIPKILLGKTITARTTTPPHNTHRLAKFAHNFRKYIFLIKVNELYRWIVWKVQPNKYIPTYPTSLSRQIPLHLHQRCTPPVQIKQHNFKRFLRDIWIMIASFPSRALPIFTNFFFLFVQYPKKTW